MDTHTRVKTARILAGLSTEQLASRLGIARTNILRWEQNFDLPRKQLENLSLSTGLPVSFLKGDGLEGLVVARPGRFISANTRGRAFAYLTENLPQLLLNSSQLEIAASSGVASVFFTDKYCMVLLPSDRVSFLYNSAQEHRQINVSDKIISDAFESDAGVNELLLFAGLERFLVKSRKASTVTLDLVTTDERHVIDKIMSTVEELRREGHDIRVNIVSN